MIIDLVHFVRVRWGPECPGYMEWEAGCVVLIITQLIRASFPVLLSLSNVIAVDNDWLHSVYQRPSHGPTFS